MAKHHLRRAEYHRKKAKEMATHHEWYHHNDRMWFHFGCAQDALGEGRNYINYHDGPTAKLWEEMRR